MLAQSWCLILVTTRKYLFRLLVQVPMTNLIQFKVSSRGVNFVNGLGDHRTAHPNLVTILLGNLTLQFQRQEGVKVPGSESNLNSSNLDGHVLIPRDLSIRALKILGELLQPTRGNRIFSSNYNFLIFRLENWHIAAPPPLPLCDSLSLWNIYHS